MGNKKSSNQEVFSTYLDELASSLKPFSSAEELVDLGVLASSKSAANMRWRGEGPAFVKCKGVGLKYPRAAVITWLRDKAVFRGGQAA
jgi:hypothetical protein